MKNIKLILITCISGLLLFSCGAPKYITVKETEIIKDTVTIKADTVRVPVPVEVKVDVVPELDTLKMETSVAESVAYLDTLTNTIKGSISNKKTELKKEIQTIEKTKFVEHKVEVPVQYEIVKNKTPRWAWVLLAVNVSIVVGLFISLYFKFKF